MEVELIVRDLDAHIRGGTIVRVEQAGWYRGSRVAKRAEASLDPLLGWTFSGVSRVGKGLIFKLENPGAGTKYMACRLGMSGSWSLKEGHIEEPQKKHWVANLWVSFPDSKFSLVFSDTRKFGTLEVRDHWSDLRCLKIYGPDIMSDMFTADVIKHYCSRHKVPIKMLLLEQSYFPGVGNWMASEILFRAHIHPLTPAKKLNLEETKRVLHAIRVTIEVALKTGGATLSSWKRPDGTEGNTQDHMLVYDRKGEDCNLCGKAKIEKITVGGRGTYFCPVCQPVDGWVEPAPVSPEFVKEIVEKSAGLL